MKAKFINNGQTLRITDSFFTPSRVWDISLENIDTDYYRFQSDQDAEADNFNFFALTHLSDDSHILTYISDDDGLLESCIVERLGKKRIIVTVQNGTLGLLSDLPEGYTLEIRDYDIQEISDETKFDDEGDEYQEILFEE